jgi:radical SAM protein with 4Fe4S-binding SPASM domain
MPGNKEFVQFNSYKQALKTLKKLFSIAQVDHITFTGGEPFMAERFNELVLYTRLQKKSVAIISNGNKAEKADYMQMMDIGVGLFELPLHSPNAEAHDFMTGTKGSWKKSLNSIQILAHMKANVVTVIVITKANYHQIKDTLLFIKNQGINRIMLNRFNIGGAGIAEKENLWLSHNDLKLTYKIAAETGRENKLLLSSNVCTPVCVLNPADYQGIAFSHCSAEVKRRPLTLDIMGNLRFCNHSPSVLGNIFTDNLDKMLESDKAKLWSTITPDFCSNCNYYARCMGGCRAASEQLNSSLNEVDPVVEILNQ